MPYVQQSGSGVLTSDGTTRFVAVPAASSTLLEQIQVPTGSVQRSTDLPGEIDRIPVGRADAARARARVGRELGLLASHAGAAAAAFAHGQGGVAIVSGPGEREFSLEPAA